jgi:hypothetical protein
LERNRCLWAIGGFVPVHRGTLISGSRLMGHPLLLHGQSVAVRLCT